MLLFNDYSSLWENCTVKILIKGQFFLFENSYKGHQSRGTNYRERQGWQNDKNQENLLRKRGQKEKFNIIKFKFNSNCYYL